jgi:hypothetical protein
MLTNYCIRHIYTDIHFMKKLKFTSNKRNERVYQGLYNCFESLKPTGSCISALLKSNYVVSGNLCVNGSHDSLYD